MGQRNWKGDPFSPDSTWLATRGSAGKLELTRLDNLETFESPHIVSAWAFDESSSRLALGFMNIEIWNLGRPDPSKEPQVLFKREGSGAQEDIVFGPAARWLATREQFGMPVVWREEAETGWGPPFALQGCDTVSPSTLKRGGDWIFTEGVSGSCFWELTLIGNVVKVVRYKDNEVALSLKGTRVARVREQRWILLHSHPLNEALAPSDPSYEVVKSTPWGANILFGPTDASFLIQGSGESPRFFTLTKQPNEKIPFDRIVASEDGRRVLLLRAGVYHVQESRKLRPIPLWSSPSAKGSALSFVPIKPQFSPDGSLLVLSNTNGNVLIAHLDSAGPILLRKIPIPASFLSGIPEFSSDNRLLAIGRRNGDIQILDLLQNTVLKVLKSGSAVTSLSFQPGRHVLAASTETGAVYVYDLKINASRLFWEDAHPQGALEFSPSGRWLAIEAAGSRIDLVPTKGGRAIRLFSTESPLSRLAFSSDERWLVGVGKVEHVQLWNLAQDTEAVQGVALPSPDRLEVKFWVQTGFAQPVFSEDSYQLTLLRSHGLPVHWELGTNKLLKQVCQVAGRNLTRQEWERFLPTEPFRPRSPCPYLPEAP